MVANPKTWKERNAEAAEAFLKALDEKIQADPVSREAYERYAKAYREIADFFDKQPEKFLAVPDPEC